MNVTSRLGLSDGGSSLDSRSSHRGGSSEPASNVGSGSNSANGDLLREFQRLKQKPTANVAANDDVISPYHQPTYGSTAIR